MGYTPSFTPQYENGWENLPSETSPITAEAFNAYDDAIENIENYLASDESQANLADAYDETATYEAGDYVIYGGDLYKCLEDIDEPEEWDSTKWEICLITDEMATSGGTTVIANPSGEATDTLNKLQVENTIYNVEGGGGNANIWTGTQAEYEAQASQIADDTVVLITDDEERTQAFEVYSTDEQVIGTWIDNKPLYKKTFVISNVTDGTNYVQSVPIKIRNYEGVFRFIASQNVTSLSSRPFDTSYRLILNGLGYDNNGLYFDCTVGSSRTGTVDLEATLYYTKNSD